LQTFSDLEIILDIVKQSDQLSLLKGVKFPVLFGLLVTFCWIVMYKYDSDNLSYSIQRAMKWVREVEDNRPTFEDREKVVAPYVSKHYDV
jgi:hypothetical protein